MVNPGRQSPPVARVSYRCTAMKEPKDAMYRTEALLRRQLRVRYPVQLIVNDGKHAVEGVPIPASASQKQVRNTGVFNPFGHGLVAFHQRSPRVPMRCRECM